jgi:murein DD-endopeptidase MepM/ murein hydrolase activator NlpD
MRALRLFLVALAAPLALWAALPLTSGASQQGRVSSLQSRIESARGALQAKHGRAVVLTSDVTAFTRRIDALQGGITRLEGQEATLQADLDAKRAELIRIRDELNAARAHLARLKARLKLSERVLARRLVELYEAGQPDLVTVVLDSHGFADLLENGAFLHRIGAQDRAVVLAVRRAKAGATTLTRRLATLEARQLRVTMAIYLRRNQVASVHRALLERRAGYARQRDAKQAALNSVHSQESHLRDRVDVLQGDVAAIQAKIRAAQQQAAAAAPVASSGGAPAQPAGPVRGGGTFIWPINGTITAPFCERRSYEACHPGMDIAAPTGTPIRAAASGSVIIAGVESGYGNYTCIQHTASLSSCYGHQSSIGVSVGQHVTQGQVIGLVGATGHATGPHLHFEARINGSVVDPMNYLGG